MQITWSLLIASGIVPYFIKEQEIQDTSVLHDHLMVPVQSKLRDVFPNPEEGRTLYWNEAGYIKNVSHFINSTCGEYYYACQSKFSHAPMSGTSIC